MPEERINLEEGLADSPQVRAQVSKLEKDLGPFKEFTTLLRDTFQACSVHQGKVCEGTETLSKLLTSYQDEATGDTDKLISGSFFRLSRYLNELHSCQEMLSTQLQNAVIELLSQFISSDFGKLEKLKENQENASIEHEQATTKFSRMSKKKDSEKSRFESNSELFIARRKFYDATLDYHSELNCFHHKKKFALLEPLLTFMHAQMAYFKVGHEILNKELGKLLTNLNTEVQRVHGDYQKEVVMAAETQAELRLKFPVMCLPDPDPTDPFLEQPILPNTTLTSKAGYLFIRTQTGFPSKWDRAYFFTKKGYLYIHMTPKPPELIVHLKGAEAASAEMDDRRYVFVVSHSSLKRPLYLLAESENQKEEWVCTINNIGQDKGNAQPRSHTKRDEAIIKMEREKIKSWVNKEIDPKKVSPLTKLSKPTPSVTPTTTTTPAPTSTTAPTSTATTGNSAFYANFPSFSSLPFLNFLDPASNSSSNQPEDSPATNGSTPQKRSPIFSRKSSATPKATEGSVSKDNGDVHMGPLVSSQPTNLPTPLQPEQLTAGAGASPSRLPQRTFSRTFFVKYLGHVEVQEGRNVIVILETIQRVVTARAMKNKRVAQSIEMTVTHKSINLYDHHANKAIGQIFLRDILRCAVQPDNSKLFGIVNRVSGEATDANKAKFLCHVMEAETTGSKVCTAINDAINAAVKIIQSNYSKSSRSQSTTAEPLENQNASKDSPYVSDVSTGLRPTSSHSMVPPPRPSRPPPVLKQKSTSDSSLGSHPGTPKHHSSSQSSPARSSTHQPNTNGRPELSTGTDQKQPTSIAGFKANFSTMQPLEEHSTATSTSSNGVDLLSFQLSSNGSSSLPPPMNSSSTFTTNAEDGNSDHGYLPKAANIVSTAAAPDSGYYQMPSSFQGGAEDLGDLSSPLTPMDPEVGSFSSMDSSNLGMTHKDSDFNNPPTHNPSGASVTSDYLSATDSSLMWPPSGAGSETTSQNSFGPASASSTPWSPFDSSSSYLSSGGTNGEINRMKAFPTQVDVPSINKTTYQSTSSQAATFSPSSFSEANQNTVPLTYSQSNTAVSDYLPSTNMFTPETAGESEGLLQGDDDDDDVDDGFTAAFSNSNFGTQTHSSEKPAPTTIATTTTNNSSQMTFPMSFENFSTDGGEFDEFDLPPLPDSLNTPTTSGSGTNYGSGGGGSGSSGHSGGYVGSIVMLGTPTTNN